MFQIKIYEVIMKYNETRENSLGGNFTGVQFTRVEFDQVGIHRRALHMKCIRRKILEQIGIGMAYLHVFLIAMHGIERAT